MKILVWGTGGREHALVWKLSQEGHQIFCIGSNPGITKVTTLLTSSTKGDDIFEASKREQIDLVVFGPEQPLIDGWADRFREAGILAYGPGRVGARLEGSKAACKEFFQKHKIPTAPFRVFQKMSAASRYIRSHGSQVVIKADGPALGKGVTVCKNADDAVEAAEDILVRNVFKHDHPVVVVEDRLFGWECSFIVITDGRDFVELQVARDYKQRYDHDLGPMTGGMGGFAPHSRLDQEHLQYIRERIVGPTLAGLAKDGVPYVGTLYFGLMVTEDGIFVLEINVRFGDPETQLVLPLLKSNLSDLLIAACQGNLKEQKAIWKPQVAVGVVLVSNGYPGAYETGLPIRGQTASSEKVLVFHAGTSVNKQNLLLTGGGRVLTIVGLGRTKYEARRFAYTRVRAISFNGVGYRRDIAFD